MSAVLTINEINELLNCEYSHPHAVLGMHKGEKSIVVRHIVPGAVCVYVENTETGEKYKLDKFHDDGYFEKTITDVKDVFEHKIIVEFEGGNIWETYDQYYFEPTLSTYDRYLFGAGNHYNIYEKLGSHVCEVNGVKGVSFALWAPNAKTVSVVGDFNEWDDRRNMMRLLGDSGIWELFIPGLMVGDKYKYSVKAYNGSTTLKIDPYGNYFEVRPQTATIVADLTYTWDDKNWMEQRDEIDFKKRPMSIYEVQLGSWARVPEDGNRFLTYLEIADRLSKYVKEMGYTHIELMPITEYPFDGSWGYQVTGYFAPTSRFGTPTEFKKFVDIMHQNGIGVIADWVPAHFPKDAHGLARFDGTALYEHEDPRRGEHLEWGTYIFNYGRNEVKNFLISNALFWLREYHIDGLRVDAVSSMLYLDYCKSEGQWAANEYGGRENIEAIEFIKHMNSVIHKEFKSAIIIAEEATSWEGITRDIEYGGLGFDLKWNMGWMNDFLRYVKKDAIYRKYHHTNVTFSIMYTHSENYVLVLSHDEVVHMKGSMMYKMPGDIWQKTAGLKVSYGYMYSHPGKKLMFMGNEIGTFAEWDEKKSLDWHVLEFDHHKNVQDYVKALNEFYKNEPALWEKDFDYDGFNWIECDDKERSIISFTRYGNTREEQISFICNFTPAAYEEFTIGVPEGVNYVEVFNSDSESFGGTGMINVGEIQTVNEAWNRCENKVTIKLPPLGFVAIKPVFK